MEDSQKFSTTDGASHQSIQSFQKDFENLSSIKDCLIEQLSDETDHDLNTVETIYKPYKNREVRLAFPQGRQALKQYLQTTEDDSDSETPQLWFVGFFGTKQSDSLIKQEVNDGIFELDLKLIEAMRRQPHIIGYCTTQDLIDQQNQNYFNLVLLSSIDAIGQWGNVDIHSNAIR